jgi:hypothetical protein
MKKNTTANQVRIRKNLNETTGILLENAVTSIQNRLKHKARETG